MDQRPDEYFTPGFRKNRLCDCVSVVTITDQINVDYMQVFMNYPINARLVDKRTIKN